jgi:hypothetical protein
VFLIFGIRRRGYRLGNVFAMCGNCHTPAAHSIVRLRSIFTFFFIPLIPFGSKYQGTCTMCGNTSSLSREQAETGSRHTETLVREPHVAAALRVSSPLEDPPHEPILAT